MVDLGKKMPEYHQIETHINIDQSLTEAIDRLKHFFDHMGWLDKNTQKWLSQFNWEVADDGIVYGSGNDPTFSINVANALFDIRLMLLGWTPKIFPELNIDCLSFEILFETEKVDEQTKYPQIRYKKSAETAVWHLMQSAIPYFPEYGVFFTNEYQDGKPWQGIIENDPSKCWLFELGIVSNQQKHHFVPISTDFFSKEVDDQLWLARKSSWDQPPWER